MLLNIPSRYERMRCSKIKVLLMKNVPMTTSGASWASSTVTWLTPMSIVLLGSNRNIVGSTGRSRCSYSSLISTGAQIGASVSQMTLLPTSKTPPFSLQHVCSSFGPLNTLISSNRGLRIVGVLNHLMLWGRKSLSSYLRSRLELRLNRMEHRSS
jgi:hypothetical protein